MVLCYSFVHLCVLIHVLFLHVMNIYILNTFLVYIMFFLFFLLFTCMNGFIFKHIHFEGLKLSCAYDDLHAYDINCYPICKPLIITSITINAIRSCVI
jgi:hypothetical protein